MIIKIHQQDIEITTKDGTVFAMDWRQKEELQKAFNTIDKILDHTTPDEMELRTL